MSLVVVGVVTGLLLFAVGCAMLLMRRSLIAMAVAGQLASLGLALCAGSQGNLQAAAVVVVAGAAVSLVVVGTAVAVHRRRGADHVDELRELRG